MLQINTPPVQTAQVTIPIPNPPRSGPKPQTRQQCLNEAAAWRRNSLAIGLPRQRVDRAWVAHVAACLKNTSPQTRLMAAFVPDPTPPPVITQPSGTRFTPPPGQGAPSQAAGGSGR